MYGFGTAGSTLRIRSSRLGGAPSCHPPLSVTECQPGQTLAKGPKHWLRGGGEVVRKQRINVRCTYTPLPPDCPGLGWGAGPQVPMWALGLHSGTWGGSGAWLAAPCPWSGVQSAALLVSCVLKEGAV